MRMRNRFHIYLLFLGFTNISLFAAEIAVFCCSSCKGESCQHKQLPCNGVKLLNYAFSAFQENSQFSLVKGTGIQLIYCAFHSKKLKDDNSNTPYKVRQDILNQHLIANFAFILIFA